MKVTPLMLLALSMSAGMCEGAKLEYRAIGTFSPFQPDTPYSAPNEPFAFAFSIPSEPLPVTIGLNYFGVPSTVELSVGSRALVVSDAIIVFFDAGSFSGFAMDFPDYSLGFGAMGLFTGPLSMPVMQVGTFPLSGGTLTVAAVPEPASFWSSVAALAGIAAVLRQTSRYRVTL